MPVEIIQVFARAPLPGQVKRRLARDLGDRRALEIYRALLAGTLKTVAEAGVSAEIWVAGSPFHPFLRRLAAHHRLPIRVQRGADLGERMWFALRHGLGRADRVILVGSDCPGLTAAHLHQARDALTEAERIVLGPSTDGGYYLIGARRAPRALFRAIDWGTDRVLDQTRRRLRSLGLPEHPLPELTDLDDGRSLRELSRGAGIFRPTIEDATGSGRCRATGAYGLRDLDLRVYRRDGLAAADRPARIGQA